MCPLLGENDTTGINVTVWEGGWASKRGKMSHRDNMSQYGKRGRHETDWKNITVWSYCHNPGKRGGHFVTATLHPTLGLGG
jgi:hypothetical protein